VKEQKEKKSYVTVVSYKLFGRIASSFVLLRQTYDQSGISRLYESYMALMLFSSLVAFVSAFVAGAFLHYFLFSLTVLQFLMAVLMLSIVAALMVSVLFVVYPVYWRNQRKEEIDSSLIYTVGYMGVLAAGGISVERIFERVIQVEHHRAIKDLAMRVITDVRVFGLDIASSLGDVIRHSPSAIFAKLLIGITNTLKTSGDLKALLTFETERLLHAKREQLKKTLNTLMGLGEVYIAGVVMGPITFIVMITILSIMGNVMFGISPVMQLNLIVFFGIPMISLIFVVVLNSFLPAEE
jgi:flagellar protein FlaJ